MSVYREKGSKVFTLDFQYNGQRIRETTRQTSITRAKEVELKRKTELREGGSGIQKKRQPKLFSFAANEWLEAKKASLALRSIVIEQFNLKHLLPALGKKLVVDIEASDISRYQKKRMTEGASPRTANIEVGTLRAIMKRYGAWARIQPQVTMIPNGEEIGRAISPAEERALLEACSKSRSRSLSPLVVLAIETGARFNTLRMLQWANVDFAERSLRFGKDKTQAGTGRVIPLNQRAIGTLTFWAASSPDRKAEDYVFCHESYGGVNGDDGRYVASESVTYAVDPTKPMGSWKTSWNSARRLAGAILAGSASDETAKPLNCRFHDLRHTAVSRMINAGVPITKVAKLVGWQPSTMIAMAGRYGHHGLEDLRSAVETVSRLQSDEIHPRSPVNPPVTETPQITLIQ